MRITFENLNTVQNQENTGVYRSDSSKSVQVQNSFLGIRSGKITEAADDSKTYEGAKKSISAFRDELAVQDVDVTQDYMTVMSNTVSAEDFGKMCEDGMDPSDIEVEDMVTIVDCIKLAVAKGGADIKGFTDTLDSETIEAMTGSTAVPGSVDVDAYDVTVDEDELEDINSAYSKISEVTEMTDGMKRFFMLSDKELSIGNLYLAKHSASGAALPQGSQYFNAGVEGYLVKKADDTAASDIEADVEKLTEGFNVKNPETVIEDGVWLINNSLAVTEENLDRLSEINETAELLPVSKETFAKAVMAAEASGKDPEDAVLTEQTSVYREAVDLTEKLEEVMNSGSVTQTRILEEARLKMTTEANLLLLKSDYSIDTEDLEKYVEALKNIEASEEYKTAETLREVSEHIEAVKELPAAVIAPIATQIPEMTLPDIELAGASMADRFAAAETAYEQVGTEVRYDLGDSIRKAFKNVDDILESMDLETSDENRRAVRILGYNSMPITQESVKTVKEADEKLQNVINRLTPADTLNIIREGKSPIEMSVQELNDYLDEHDDEEKEEIEKYSKFLYKLDRTGGISEEERAEFIDTYRFFFKLEKTDMAAVGSVVNAGQELTIGNLKTAMKTAKNRGMDVKVDDSFGTLVSDIRSELLPEKLVNVGISDSDSLESLADELRQQPVDSASENEWIREQYTELKEAMKAPDEVVTELVMNRIPVTESNLLGMTGLMKQRGLSFSKIYDTDDEVFTEEAEKLVDSFDDEESASEQYDRMIDAAQEAVYREALLQDDYVDVKALKLVHMELKTAQKLADSETYEVPMEIDGEATSINLKIVHGSEEDSNVVVSFETENLGRVSARLAVVNEKINGYIACNSEKALSKMENAADTLGKEVHVVLSDKSDTDETLSRIPMRDNTDVVSTKELYEVAKKFLTALRG